MNALKSKALLVVLLISAGVNVGIGRMIITSHSRPATVDVAPGTLMPPLRAVDRSSTATVINYSDVSIPTIVYVFSPKCGFCQKNAENMAALARLTSGRYRLIGISTITDGLTDFVEQTNITFPVYTKPDPSVGKAYRLAGTPHTFVIGPDGRLKQAWAGAYIGQVQSKIEAYFSVKLPGIKTKGA